jgi:hypothetical protein
LELVESASIFFPNLIQQANNVQQNQNTNEWTDELDALSASPQHHKLLFEN